MGPHLCRLQMRFKMLRVCLRLCRMRCTLHAWKHLLGRRVLVSHLTSSQQGMGLDPLQVLKSLMEF